MLAFWTGGKTLQTNKLHNNVTDSSSKNPEVTIDQAPPSQNLDVPNQGISSSSGASDPSNFEKWAIKDEVLKAEILSTMHNVVNHYSFQLSCCLVITI